MNTNAPNLGNESLSSSLRQVVDEADQLLKDAVQTGDQKFDAMRGKFMARLEQMRGQLDELEQDAMQKARRAARAADHAVHEHPYGAMGIAAAAGLLIGFLAARR